MPLTPKEPVVDVARIERSPGMDREQWEDFYSGLARYVKAYGCKLIEFCPEEILEREQERLLCRPATPNKPAGHNCMNPEKDSALTNFPVLGAKEMMEEEKANLNPDPEQMVQIHRRGPNFASGGGEHACADCIPSASPAIAGHRQVLKPLAETFMKGQLFYGI